MICVFFLHLFQAPIFESNIWGLLVSVLIFPKPKDLSKNSNVMPNNSGYEVVNYFCYLGSHISVVGVTDLDVENHKSKGNFLAK